MSTPAPDAVKRLVDRFDQDREVFLSGDYKEEQLRLEFLNPFFTALGWDMDNKQGLSETFKQVIHEESIKVAGASKAPDYTFRIGGRRTFFVEAKKPAVKLASDSAPAFQLRRYAWTARLPVSILSDFEEFAVYDCRLRPFKTDNPATARTMLLGYQDYATRWDELSGLFSPDAIQRGALERYVESTKTKKGTTAVDDAFLEEISRWRDLLAKNIALRNPRLSTRELNFAVQRTIDRLIFLRICEDRGIESYAWLQSLLNGERVYARLLKHFRDADDKYNSGLFCFSERRAARDMTEMSDISDRVPSGFAEPPDRLSLELNIDDKPLKDIIGNLYYPDSPYEFSVMPADVLGQVYEQFLGKVIRLTAGHQAKVEEKPEVRKAGGVYYTPTYIVDYIVKNTVGKLLEGKTPKEAEALRILDPACGSGSFLLGAYQFLLDWHLDWYQRQPQATSRKPQAPLHQDAKGNWRLTTAERKRILLNNIYGVDIDSQAVEVTKLSLLLKVLEGENQETLGSQLKLYHERALPDLGSNIKCGNSLIGPDFYEGEQQALFVDEEQRLRINTFDWNQGFPDIMKRGGFDAVIGNPPYIFTRNQGIDEPQKAYFYSHFKHQSAQLNTFGIFVEQSHAALRDGGLLGFITPNNWLTIESFGPLREFILRHAGNVKIVNILDRVFAAASVDTAITLFAKSGPTKLTIAEISGKDEVFSRRVPTNVIQPPNYIIQIGLLKDTESMSVLRRIEERSSPLRNFCTVSTGLKAYQIGKGKPVQTNEHKSGRVFHSPTRKNKTYGRYLDGVDVSRYNLGWSGEYLSYGDWLAEPRKSVPFAGQRLLVRQIPARPPYLVHAVFTDEPFYNDINSMVAFAPKDEVSLKYLLGIINSRLVSYWFSKTYDKLQRSIFPQFKVGELGLFPVWKPDMSNSHDEAQHDKMVELVEFMLNLHKDLPKAKTPHEQESFQRQIAATDKAIDALVYELFGLTEEEIRIVTT